MMNEPEKACETCSNQETYRHVCETCGKNHCWKCGSFCEKCGIIYCACATTTSCKECGGKVIKD